MVLSPLPLIPGGWHVRLWLRVTSAFKSTEGLGRDYQQHRITDIIVQQHKTTDNLCSTNLVREELSMSSPSRSERCTKYAVEGCCQLMQARGTCRRSAPSPS